MWQYRRFASAWVMIIAGVAAAAFGQGRATYIAYSLREASSRAQARTADKTLLRLGGITRVAGMVYDEAGKDIILLGLAAPDLPEARFDDLVVALRARLVYDEYPLVSIDPTENTSQDKLQTVRFAGGLANTPFGRDFLECDVLLKKYSLQQLDAVSSVPPYNLMLEEDIREKAKSQGTTVTGVRWLPEEKGAGLCQGYQGHAITDSSAYQARFWFYVSEPYNAACKPDDSRPIVFCLRELRLCLLSENTSEDLPGAQRMATIRYGQNWTRHFNDVCKAYPTLKKLKTFYDLVAVADAARKIEKGVATQPYLPYLLREYPVARAPTDTHYRLHELYGVVERADARRHIVRVSGGIELRPQIRLLNYGQVTSLRSIVLDSRPSPTTLTWVPPLDGWQMPNAKDLEIWPREKMDETGVTTPDGRQRVGCSVVCQSVLLDAEGSPESNPAKRFFGFSPPVFLPPLKGVSMRMEVTDSSFNLSPELDAPRQKALDSRDSEDSLTWPME